MRGPRKKPLPPAISAKNHRFHTHTHTHTGRRTLSPSPFQCALYNVKIRFPIIYTRQPRAAQCSRLPCNFPCSEPQCKLSRVYIHTPTFPKTHTHTRRYIYTCRIAQGKAYTRARRRRGKRRFLSRAIHRHMRESL